MTRVVYHLSVDGAERVVLDRRYWRFLAPGLRIERTGPGPILVAADATCPLVDDLVRAIGCTRFPVSIDDTRVFDGIVELLRFAGAAYWRFECLVVEGGIPEAPGAEFWIDAGATVDVVTRQQSQDRRCAA